MLVVDDEADLRALLCAALTREGYEVTALSGGGEVGQAHCRWADIIVLDVMMPGEDGFAVCRRIREATDCPILFLTAKSEEADVLTGLGVGGDDYIVKPFRVAELRARVAAHLRRAQRAPRTRVLRGAYAFDMQAQRVYRHDAPIALTRGEYGICEMLALHAGQVFTREQIYEAVFGLDGTADGAVIAEHVKNIRAKLKSDGGGESPIQTVWGVGYRWKEG